MTSDVKYQREELKALSELQSASEGLNSVRFGTDARDGMLSVLDAVIRHTPLVFSCHCGVSPVMQINIHAVLRGEGFTATTQS